MLWSFPMWCLISGVFYFENTKNIIKFIDDLKFLSKAICWSHCKPSTYATCYLFELCQIVVTLSEIHFILPWSRSHTHFLHMLCFYTRSKQISGRKCKMTNTKRTAQKAQSTSGHTLAIASAPNADVLTVLSLLHQKVIDNFQPFFLIVMHTLMIISFGIPKHSRQRYRRGGRPRDCLSNISDSSGISFVHSSPSDIYLIFVFLR